MKITKSNTDKFWAIFNVIHEYNFKSLALAFYVIGGIFLTAIPMNKKPCEFVVVLLMCKLINDTFDAEIRRAFPKK
jgi:hypothetical protein